MAALESKYEFVTEPEGDLICAICLEVAEDPWQHDKCGRLLCKKCLNRLGRDQPCPHCRREHPLYFEDARSKRAILSLTVKCNNVERSCEWVGTVDTVNEHVRKCDYTPLPCPNECEDEDGRFRVLMRRDLDKHLQEVCPNRDYECKFCGVMDKYAVITQIHNEVCPQKPVICPNEGCTSMIERQNVDFHQSCTCGHTIVFCKYKDLGCNAVMKRKDMEAHEEDDKLHLRKAIDKTVELQARIYSLEQDESGTIASLRDEIASNKKEINNHRGEIASLKEKMSSVLTFSVSEFEHRKNSAVIYKSPSFYTSAKGYLMQIIVDAKGSKDENGEDCVSVYVSILKGKHDSKLIWPFQGEVTITLLNQYEDSHHWTVTIHETDTTEDFGVQHFIRHYELDYHLEEDRKFLDNDTLYFRVSVKIPNHKPWLQCKGM